jgi:LacI family transcriptional regulator
MKKLSIVDIANSLNISKTTVSFILNGRAREKRISDEMIERVLKYVNEVGYKPNTLAKSLRTGKSHTIGLLVQDISNHFFAAIARQIEDRAYKNGYKIIYSSTDNDTRKAKELIALFRDQHVDGYIIVPPLGIEADIEDLIADGFPVVLFDRYLPGVETDHVLVDNLFSTYNATRLLIDKGYEHIAFISYQSTQTQMEHRKQGYQKAIEESKLKPNILEVDFYKEEKLIIEEIRSFILNNKNTDAVLFGNNYLGTCGLKVFRSSGIKIPDDIALISFDDLEVFELYTPEITAIAQPVETIAEEVITILLNRLNNVPKDDLKQQVTLATELKIRKSTR